MHTFFLENIPEPGALALLAKREQDHLFKTLRCRSGEQLKLCDGRGTVALAEAMADRSVKIIQKESFERDRVQLHLFAALPKNAKLDSLLKPVTEAGVAGITPLKCRYSVSEKDQIPERWYTLLEEACKQSGNPFLPEISPALSVAEAVKLCQENNYRIFYGAQHGKYLTPAAFPGGGKLDLAWFVGPEGGFDENEIALLDGAGCGITVGKYIFRLENAAIAGSAYLLTCAHAAEEESDK